MLGSANYLPHGFALDHLNDRIGRALLLETPSLKPLWTAWDNAPVMPLTSFNNTVVLGSVVAWLVLFIPIWLLARQAVIEYRARLAEKVRRNRIYQAVTATKAYNVYTWFRG